MLLAVDIGNTNITFGVFKGKRLAKRFDISTKYFNLKALRKNLGRIELNDAVISSVVPESTKVVSSGLRKLLCGKPYIIGKDIKVPIKNLYRKPGEVGQDRLVNAYAGTRLYGAPLIVVDFGTCLTFDCLSRKKEYLGGMILPGLGISLDSLYERTALLPKVKLARPKEFIGRDTRSSILSGIVFGFACLSDELINRIKVIIGRGARVIGTGGNISLIKDYCRQIDRVDRELTLKGLNLIYKELVPGQL